MACEKRENSLFLEQKGSFSPKVIVIGLKVDSLNYDPKNNSFPRKKHKNWWSLGAWKSFLGQKEIFSPKISYQPQIWELLYSWDHLVHQNSMTDCLAPTLDQCPIAAGADDGDEKRRLRRRPPLPQQQLQWSLPDLKSLLAPTGSWESKVISSSWENIWDLLYKYGSLLYCLWKDIFYSLLF